jgi:hypothetical protein
MPAKTAADMRECRASRLLVVVLTALVPAIAQADAKRGEKKVELCVLCDKPNHPESIAPTLE